MHVARKKALIFSLLLIVGCSHANLQMASLTLPIEQRPLNHTQASYADQRPSDEAGGGYFVGLALSGGGSRSANFSAACMFELQRLGILQKMTCISSVSGGSLAAAYYCLNDHDWNPQQAQTKLTHSFAADVILTAFQPWMILLMTVSPLDRSDVLAWSFDRTLYQREGKSLRFADLRKDRPRLLINATDMHNGRPFVICDETFDSINSDLAKYPISYAVAASSAVPVLLHPVTLKDFSTTFPQYRHLVDGGVTDNLGVSSLIESYVQQIRLAKQRNRPDPYPRGMILIVVDAHTEVDADIDNKADTGLLDSLSTSAGLSSTVLLNRVSSATLADVIVRYSPDNEPASELRKNLETLERTGTLFTHDRDNKPVRVVHLALTQLTDVKDLPSIGFGTSVNNIATYFSIEPSAAYTLYQAAHVLIGSRFAEAFSDIQKALAEPASQP